MMRDGCAGIPNLRPERLLNISLQYIFFLLSDPLFSPACYRKQNINFVWPNEINYTPSFGLNQELLVGLRAEYVHEVAKHPGHHFHHRQHQT